MRREAASYARISKSASSSCKKASRATRSPQPPSLPRAPQGTSAGSPLSYPERHPDGAAPRSAWLRGASTGLPRRAGRVGGATARGRKIPCRSCIAMVPCALLIENRGGRLSISATHVANLLALRLQAPGESVLASPFPVSALWVHAPCRPQHGEKYCGQIPCQSWYIFGWRAVVNRRIVPSCTRGKG